MYMLLADIASPTYAELVTAILLIVNFVIVWINNRKLTNQKDHLLEQDKQLQLIHRTTNGMKDALVTAAYKQGQDNPKPAEHKK